MARRQILLKSRIRLGSLLPCLFFICSCASFSRPALQAQVDGLLTSGRVVEAADTIGSSRAQYGRNNDLLYYLDRGLLEQYAGRYSGSIASFEKAKQRFDELYTKSVSRELASWLINDYALPYRGADFEYVLLNVLQALNYLSLGNVQEALVEARDMDAKYQAVADQSKAMKRRHFEDNGFARLFMGLVHEASGRADDRDQARLYYEEALAAYQQYYGGNYQPRLLEERKQAVAALSSDRSKAAINLLQFIGMAPVKESEMIAVPLEKGLIIQVAFPRYLKRDCFVRRGLLVAEDAQGRRYQVETELGVSVEDLAFRDMEERRALLLTKAIARPALKYLIERKQQENIEKSSGDAAGLLFGLVSSVYNVITERADIRSWQSLPAEIRIARLDLPAGEYRIWLENIATSGGAVNRVDFGRYKLESGQTTFLTGRGNR